jgi:phosphate transport system permease protein
MNLFLKEPWALMVIFFRLVLYRYQKMISPNRWQRYIAQIKMFFGQSFFLFALFLGGGGVLYAVAVKRVTRLSGQSGNKLHSLKTYYGLYTLLWTLFPALVMLLGWAAVSDPFLLAAAKSRLVEEFPKLPDAFINLKLAQVQNIADGLIATKDSVMMAQAELLQESKTQSNNLRLAFLLLILSCGGGFALFRLTPELQARIFFETFLRRLFFTAAVIAILTTIGIVASLLIEAIRFFSEVPLRDFFFGTHWSPMVSLRSGGGDEDVAGSSGSFGMVPVLLGTVLVAFIAMMVAVPIGLFAAIYMAEFASMRIRNIVKPTLEVLAGVPTVVYGFFAAITVAPFLRSIGLSFGLDVSSQSALAAGVVMGIMIIPFISSLSDDVITAVPQSLRDGALGLGSTHGESVMRVVLPAAFPGLVGSFLLAISRAIGETMIVVMAAGVAANLTINPLESVTTVTVQIVMLLTGDNEFDNVRTLSAFALGITLFFATLMLNIVALMVSRRLGGRYE